MIFSVRKLKDQLKFLLIFIVFTYALYHLLVFITQWIAPTHKYKQPAGKAVKVFQEHVIIPDQGPMADRLKLFYWLGE